MRAESEIAKALRLAFKLALPLFVSEGTVTSVNKEEKTCEVDRDELPDLQKVRLNAILDPGNNIMTIFPKQGSKVLCVMVANDPSDAFILSATEIEEIQINIGGSSLRIVEDGISFNGGEIGGMVKGSELKTQLDKLTARVDGIIDAIKNGVPVAMDGGVALQQTIVAALNLITEKEDFTNIENDQITH